MKCEHNIPEGFRCFICKPREMSELQGESGDSITKDDIESAIADLREIKNLARDYYGGEDSIDLAISALEGKLCESCGETEDKCLCDMDE